MSLLASLDPGETVIGLIIAVVLQTSVVILVARGLGRGVLGQRADARHVVWLGALVLILISPAAAVVARRLGVALCVIPFPGWEDGTMADYELIREERPVARDRCPTQRAGRRNRPMVRRRLRGPRHEAIASMSIEPARSNVARLIRPESGRRRSALAGGLTVLWVAGVLAGLARLAVGWRRTDGALACRRGARCGTPRACTRTGPRRLWYHRITTG